MKDASVSVITSYSIHYTKLYDASLQEINLSDNYITYLWGLEDLPALQELSLSGNKINDITELAALDSVNWLVIDHNFITDVSPLLDMDSLEYLWVDYNSSAETTISTLRDEGVEVYTN